MIKFSDIHDAYSFVSSSGGLGEVSACLDKETGRLYYRSEAADIDELEDEDVDIDSLIEIPSRNDLDLGQQLVFDFVNDKMPNEYGRVKEIFRKRGAYGRLRSLLQSIDLLESWYEFESRREEEELRMWCEDNEIELAD